LAPVFSVDPYADEFLIAPTRFDITRRASGNLAFGTGIHGCVGQMIARMEGEIVLRTLESALPASPQWERRRSISTIPCVASRPCR
jgi:cytochrome P450